MEKEFCNYQQSLKLKELGFDEPCFGWYENNELVTLLECIYPEDRLEFIKVGEISKRISAPTFSQAFRWFREKQAIEGFIHKAIEGTYYFVIKRLGNNESNMYEFITNAPKNVDTFEEAELACLDKLIEIVETK